LLYKDVSGTHVFPSVLLECLALGAKVITNRNEITAELMDNFNIEMFKPGRITRQYEKLYGEIIL